VEEGTTLTWLLQLGISERRPKNFTHEQDMAVGLIVQLVEHCAGITEFRDFSGLLSQRLTVSSILSATIMSTLGRHYGSFWGQKCNKQSSHWKVHLSCTNLILILRFLYICNNYYLLIIDYEIICIFFSRSQFKRASRDIFQSSSYLRNSCFPSSVSICELIYFSNFVSQFSCRDKN